MRTCDRGHDVSASLLAFDLHSVWRLESVSCGGRIRLLPLVAPLSHCLGDLDRLIFFVLVGFVLAAQAGDEGCMSFHCFRESQAASVVLHDLLVERLLILTHFFNYKVHYRSSDHSFLGLT